MSFLVEALLCLVSTLASVGIGADAIIDHALAADAPIVVVGLDAGSLVVLDSADGAVRARVDLGEALHSVDVDPSGQLVAALTSTGRLILWHWSDAAPSTTRPFGENRSVRDGHVLAFDPTGERLLVGVVGVEAKVVARDGRELGTLPQVTDLWRHTAAQWGVGGERIAALCGNAVVVVDGRTCAPLLTNAGAPLVIETKAKITCFELHPAQPRLATGHADGRIRVHELATGAEVQCLEHVDPFWGPPPKEPLDNGFDEVPSIGWLAHSRDGSRLAYTTVSGVHLGCFDLARAERIAISPFAGGRMGVPSPITWGPGDRRVYYTFSALHWLQFGYGPRYGDFDVRAELPSFGPGGAGVCLVGGDLCGFDDASGALTWRVGAEALARASAPAAPNAPADPDK